MLCIGCQFRELPRSYECVSVRISAAAFLLTCMLLMMPFFRSYTDQFGQSCPYIVGSGYLCDELPENKAACCGCGGGLQGMLVPGGPPLGNESSGDQTGYNLKAAKAYSVVVVACAAFVCLATVISYGRSWKNNKMGKLSPQKKRALQERLNSGHDAYGMETMSPFEIDSYDSDEADDLVFITN